MEEAADTLKKVEAFLPRETVSIIRDRSGYVLTTQPVQRYLDGLRMTGMPE